MLLEVCINLCSFRGWTCSPGIIPTEGNTQDSALRGDRPKGLVRFHEREDFLCIASVSAANQAAAFDNISRSMRNCLFSRRRRRNSSRSSRFRPSSRSPSSRSAWRIQFWMVCAVGSNSLANSDGERPARTSSTILALQLGWIRWTCWWHSGSPF